MDKLDEYLEEVRRPRDFAPAGFRALEKDHSELPWNGPHD